MDDRQWKLENEVNVVRLMDGTDKLIEKFTISSNRRPIFSPMLNSSKENIPRNKTAALSSGAVAGLCVDLTLYPLDTIKTRLQSQQGFKASGGFSRIYAGVPAVTIGSAPSAALFFLSYETMKRQCSLFPHPTFAHMTAACIGELAACLIRVPTEVFKQRAQAAPGISTFRLMANALANDGLPAFYRGYWSTVSRELPFSLIEFPLWEFLKIVWSTIQETPVTPIQTATCGSIAGAIAAGLTTPLDLAKTRIMLTSKITGEKMTVKSVLTDVYRHEGVKGLFAGFWPRITWMALGGFVFFGAYDKAVHVFNGITAPETAPDEHFHLLGLQHMVMERFIKIVDYLLYDEETVKKRRNVTFDDVLEEAAESEETRQAFIAAARRKFGGREKLG